MREGFIRVKLIVSLCALFFFSFLATTWAGGLGDSFFFGGISSGKDHHHDSIDIISRPIVKKISVPLFRPRRILVDSAGNVFIADWGAGSVIRVSPNGAAHQIGRNLNEPAGLALDLSGNLYVSQHAQGMPEAGSIVKIAPDGEQSIFAKGFTGPTGITFDDTWNLFVANFHDNSISRITPDGEVSTFATEIPHPAALVFDRNGLLHAVSSTEGSVLRFDTNGKHSVLARGLFIPSDISIDAEGHLIVSNFGGTSLSFITPQGEVRTFAMVPKGTISVNFDQNGNFWLVNWDDHYLMKVTTHLSLPCPHCDGRIPVRLRSPQTHPKPSNRLPRKPVKVI